MSPTDEAKPEEEEEIVTTLSLGTDHKRGQMLIVVKETGRPEILIYQSPESALRFANELAAGSFALTRKADEYKLILPKVVNVCACGKGTALLKLGSRCRRCYMRAKKP